jgi:hypothetical protein
MMADSQSSYYILRFFDGSKTQAGSDEAPRRVIIAAKSDEAAQTLAAEYVYSQSRGRPGYRLISITPYPA